MSWFKARKCECCEVLKSEVGFLRSLTRPTPLNAGRLPSVTLEADAIIGGSDHQITYSKEELERQAELDSEAAKLLSGGY